ncbi:hypothetical protein [Amycolatopsis keratiniphila]|uniref:hypothetical protein n=1 Tax=Amycolatopsis keratiniphila TaxID=129921 RepID=UPI00087B0DC9|nr:hypothetical protein [Amycolatopsis keratiniphila]SDU12038.1 hypothetical protein SAMN04489733_1303 [Amycolatopsis keratiniphila]
MNKVGTRRVALPLALVGSAVVLLVGCSGGTGQVTPSSPNLSAPPQAATSSGQDERAAVKTAYSAFWSRTLQADDEPEETWRAAMAAVAVDPQLTTTLNAMRTQKQAGIKVYGDVTARIQSVEVDGASAIVRDCQDASRTGQADATTGDPKTVGVPRNPVSADLKRDSSDGRWRVAKVAFPGGTC